MLLTIIQRCSRRWHQLHIDSRIPSITSLIHSLSTLYRAVAHQTVQTGPNPLITVQMACVRRLARVSPTISQLLSAATDRPAQSSVDSRRPGQSSVVSHTRTVRLKAAPPPLPLQDRRHVGRRGADGGTGKRRQVPGRTTWRNRSARALNHSSSFKSQISISDDSAARWQWKADVERKGTKQHRTA